MRVSDDRVDHLERELRELRARVDALERQRLALVRAPKSGHRRGKSPVAAITAGGTRVAQGRGARMTHEQICAVLKDTYDGVMTLGYSLALVGAAMLPPAKRNSQAANVILLGGEFILNGYLPLPNIFHGDRGPKPRTN